MRGMRKIQVYAKKDDITRIHIFRNGFQQQHSFLLGAKTGGSLMSKSVGDAIKIT